MERSTAAKVISDLYKEHKDSFLSESLSVGKIDGVFYTDLEGEPATIRVVYSDSATGNLSSFSILGDVGVFKAKRLGKIRDKVSSRLAQVDAGEDLQNDPDVLSYTASEAVSDFGLFGVDPKVGSLSRHVFLKKLRSSNKDEDYKH